MSIRTVKLPLASALVASLVAGAVLVPSASAAPRVTSVNGLWLGESRTADYLVLDVRTRGATHVRLRWRGRGGAYQRVRRGRVTIGFANNLESRFRLSARACVRRRCGRAQRFSGRFRPAPRDTSAPPNSQPNPVPEGPGLPGVPTLPDLPDLPGVPQVPGIPQVPVPSIG